MSPTSEVRQPTPGGVTRRRRGCSRTRRVVLVLAISAALIGALGWGLVRSDDPRFHGKRLSAWLLECNPRLEAIFSPADELDPKTAEELRRAREAATAVRAIGSNAVPYLLKLAATPDSTLRRRASDAYLEERAFIYLKSQKVHDVIRAYIEKPWNDHRLAGAGFKILGAQAKPAVPGLIRLLGSRDSGSRETAADALGAIGPTAQEAIPALIQRINDPDVEDSAVEALFAIGMKPEIAVPALTKLLEADEGDFIRAMHLLGNFGIQAKSAAPALLPFLEVEDVDLREKATNVLRQIDPGAAAKVGIK